MPSWLLPITATAWRRSHDRPVWKYGAVSAMLRSVGTLNTYSSLAVFVTEKRPLSFGGSRSAPGFSTVPNGAYMPPPTLMPLWHPAQPLSMNARRPDFCGADSAPASPFRKRSKGEFGVISVASKTAIAFCAFARLTGCALPGNAALKLAA